MTTFKPSGNLLTFYFATNCVGSAAGESKTASHIGGAWPCVPSDKDAQQVNVIGPRQQHSHAQSQFEHEEPADDLVDAVALAQRQEVEVVQVRSNVRHTCRGQKPSRVSTK